SPFAHARVERLDLSPALDLPGVHAAIGPDDLDVLERECGYQGAPVAAVCADTEAQARAAVAAIAVDWVELDVILDPDEAVAAGDVHDEARVRERGDVEAGFAQADVVVEGEYRTQVVLHNSLETHQAVAQWVGDTLEVHISTQYIWGVRREIAKALDLPA